MKNSIFRKLYHQYIIRRHKMKTFRGGWMLTYVYLRDYQKFRGRDIKEIIKAHSKGWSLSDYKILKVNKSNQKQFLSTRDYCSMHPFNGEFSAWIDDKLTLKYLLYGTSLGSLMPRYYMMIDENGCIIPLPDVKHIEPNVNLEASDVLEICKRESTLAVKKIKGSIGDGFIKMSYDSEHRNYLFNNKSYTPKEAEDFLYKMRNYLIMEYLSPHKDFIKFSPDSVGCLRYQLGRTKNGELKDLFAFLRIGTQKSGYVENYNSGGILTYIDLITGEYDGGNELDQSTYQNHKILYHPDSNIRLKGKIPNWDKLKSLAHAIAAYMPQLKYIGIDFCITDDGIRMIEINSLTSLDSFQLELPVFNSSYASFFKERLS